MKTCSKCKTDKDLTNFRLVKSRHGKVSHHSYCDDCRKADKRARSGCKPKEIIVNTEAETKKCSVCSEWKSFTEFDKDKKGPAGLFSQCKVCRVTKSKTDYQANKDKIKARTNQYYYDNKPEVIKTMGERRKQRMSDPMFKVKRNIRNSLWYSLRRNSWKKSSNFSKYIGCDLPTLKAHLEQQFQPGMSWDNYGSMWHIDHVTPLDNANTTEELYKLNHYTNLRPLWAKQNYAKNNRVQSTPFGVYKHRGNYRVCRIAASEARDLVETKHYSKVLPRGLQYCFGMYLGEELVGVACYGSPSTTSISKGITDEDVLILELKRVALKYNKPNEASILVGLSLRFLPKPSIVISYSDTAQNHTGIIYQSTNFKYYGLTESRKNWSLKSKPQLHPLSVADLSLGQENRLQWMKDTYGDDFQLIDRVRKHRYIYICADSKTKKSLESKIKYIELSYPKKN